MKGDHGLRSTLSIVACAVVLLGGSLVSPAAFGEAAAMATAPTVMTVGVVQEPDTLNPFGMLLSISWTINFLHYDTLNSLDEDLNPGPQLADSWSNNTDGTVWTFNINRTAFWHDGVQVTAHDVAFTFNLILDNQEECALFIDYLRDFTEVIAVDDFTLRITTSVPKATMLSIMVPIVPEHIWKDVPINVLNTVDPWDPTYFPDGPIGSGPLILEKYDTQLGYIRMLKWPNYYIDVVTMDEVVFKIFTSDDAMMTSLYGNSIDVATQVPARVWDATLAYDDIDGQAVDALSFFELAINCATEEMRDAFPHPSTNLETTNLSVRQAIAMAVNETTIVTEVLNSLAAEGSTAVPKASAYWHYNITEAEDWGFDIAEANALLDRAGYIDSDDDGIRENSTSGVPLDFIFYYRSEKVDDQLASEMIAEWLAQIGIHVEPEGVTESSLYNIWLGCKYDMFIWAWDTDVDPSFILSVFTTGQIPTSQSDWSKWSDCWYSNAYYDSLFELQQNTPDPAGRQAIIFEMQQILYRDCPYVILWYPMSLYAYRTDKWSNFPDMVNHPGMTPMGMWFYFEVTTSTATENSPPTNVNAGLDRTAYVNDTLTFTGDAVDENDPDESLNWTWVFSEPDDSSTTLYGKTVSYKFVNLGNVSVTLLVRDPGGLTGSDDLVVTVEPVPADAGWILGYVRDSLDEPIEGATVGIGANVRTTSVEGFYNFTVSAGTYQVNVTAIGYSSVQQDVTVANGTVEWANFTLTALVGRVVGRVVDSESGIAIVDATIRLNLGTSNKTARTNSTGYYEISLVPAGSYPISASKTGYEANSTTVEVVAGETSTVDFQLTISDDDGGGISTTALIAVAGLIIVIVVIALVAMMMKRKKAGAEPPPPPTE